MQYRCSIQFSPDQPFYFCSTSIQQDKITECGKYCRGLWLFIWATTARVPSCLDGFHMRQCLYSFNIYKFGQGFSCWLVSFEEGPPIILCLYVYRQGLGYAAYDEPGGRMVAPWRASLRWWARRSGLGLTRITNNDRKLTPSKRWRSAFPFSSFLHALMSWGPSFTILVITPLLGYLWPAALNDTGVVACLDGVRGFAIIELLVTRTLPRPSFNPHVNLFIY